MQGDPLETKAKILLEIIRGNKTRLSLRGKMKELGIKRRSFSYHMKNPSYGLIPLGIVKEKHRMFRLRKDFNALVETVRCLLSSKEIGDYIKGSLCYWIGSSYDAVHGDLAIMERQSELWSNGRSGGYTILDYKAKHDFSKPWTLDYTQLMKETRGIISLDFAIAYIVLCWEMEGYFKSGYSLMVSDTSMAFLTENIIFQRINQSKSIASKDALKFVYKKLIQDPITMHGKGMELGSKDYWNYLQRENYEEKPELTKLMERIRILFNADLEGALSLTDGIEPDKEDDYLESDAIQDDNLEQSNEMHERWPDDA